MQKYQFHLRAILTLGTLGLKSVGGGEQYALYKLRTICEKGVLCTQPQGNFVLGRDKA